MKDNETVEKFIQLRAEGKSFDKIAKLIKVSKQTLLGWEGKYETRIDDLKAIRYEAILEKYKLTQEERLTRLAKEINLAWEGFEQKGYENLSKRDALQIIMRLEKSLSEEPAMKAKAKKKDDIEEPELKKILISRSIIGAESEKMDRTIRTLLVSKKGGVLYNYEKEYYGTEAEVEEMLKKENEQNEADGDKISSRIYRET